MAERPCPERSQKYHMDLPHDWRTQRTGGGRVIRQWCWDCREERSDDLTEELLNLMWMIPNDQLFDPGVNDAVVAFLDGKDHPIIDSLRAECQAIEQERASATGTEEGTR